MRRPELTDLAGDALRNGPEGTESDDLLRPRRQMEPAVVGQEAGECEADGLRQPVRRKLDEGAVVILSDLNDKPVASAGFKAHAILIVGGKTQRFALEPADGARLAGKAPVAIPAGTKGVVQLTAPDGATAQAKF